MLLVERHNIPSLDDVAAFWQDRDDTLSKVVMPYAWRPLTAAAMCQLWMLAAIFWRALDACSSYRWALDACCHCHCHCPQRHKHTMANAKRNMPASIQSPPVIGVRK